MAFVVVMRGKSFFREAIRSFLSHEMPQVEVVAVEDVGQLQMLRESLQTPISLVLLYIGRLKADHPDVINWIAQARLNLATVPIALVGDDVGADEGSLALAAGAQGYIPATTPPDVVIHALPIVATGGLFAPPFVYGNCHWGMENGHGGQSSPSPEPTNEVAGPRFDGHEAAEDITDPNSIAFTSRETEVMSLLSRGLPNKLIAHRLNLKEGTVKVHVRNIMRKLHVTSRTQAALIGQKYFPDPVV
jgi:DNA-binding NarL/FixJ family response regulator